MARLSKIGLLRSCSLLRCRHSYMAVLFRTHCQSLLNKKPPSYDYARYDNISKHLPFQLPWARKKYWSMINPFRRYSYSVGKGGETLINKWWSTYFLDTHIVAYESAPRFSMPILKRLIFENYTKRCSCTLDKERSVLFQGTESTFDSLRLERMPQIYGQFLWKNEKDSVYSRRRTLSMNRTPSRWSISWQKATASKSLTLNRT